MRPCPGYDGYEVDEFGHVWSRGRPINGWLDKDGYRRVTINLKGRKKHASGIHRLVLEAFVGPCPDGCAASHLDGDKTNNMLSNLKWETWSVNNLRRVEHGRLPLGSNIKSSKLTEDQVKEIRASYTGAHGELTALSKKFGVSRTNISNIVNRRWWKS